MAKKPYDLLVFIGRFQPFHLGHKAIIDQALQKAHKVLILIGSANSGRTLRNPFTYEERSRMILETYTKTAREFEIDADFHTAPISDYPYNEARWLRGVQDTVAKFANEGDRIGLIGRNKDNSSYYLKLFPQWDSIAGSSDRPMLDATNIRNGFFGGGFWRQDLPQSSHEFMESFIDTKTCDDLREEFGFIRRYKEKWKNSPHPVIFQTVDAVVHCSGHVLTIERKYSPGRGKLALPGGFINPDETLEQAVVRELTEETGLKVSITDLMASLKARHTFDSPHRDPRGRFISTGFLFKLPPRKTLPRIQAGDDAAAAHWTQHLELEPSNMFADHGHIVEHMIAQA